MVMDEIPENAIVLLLDLPPSAFCGIDLLSFTSSVRFKGIKGLPTGWHFLFTGVNSSLSLRHGVWFFVEKQNTYQLAPQLFVFRWNAQREELCREQDQSEVSRWRANLGSLWRQNLSPYRQSVESSHQSDQENGEKGCEWSRLTDCIAKQLLSKILGDSEQHYWTINSASSASRDLDSIPGLSNEETEENREKDLGFLPINLKQTWRDGAIGRERTEAAQDRSWAFVQLTQNDCAEPADILGEFQFCFLMILTLNNNSCLEQWRRLLTLILTCKTAALKQATFFEHFLRCLKLQLKHCQDAEGGLLDLSDSEGSLLKSLLSRFRQDLDGYAGQEKLEVMDALDDLDDYLGDQYGWPMHGSHVRSGMIDLEDGERVEMDLNGVDEEDETGEYAPTVVDLSPEHGSDASQLNVQSALPDAGTTNATVKDTDPSEEAKKTRNWKT